MLELLTPEEMGRADRLAIDQGRSGLELMEVAGAAVAHVAQMILGAAEGNAGTAGSSASQPDSAPAPRRITVLAGPGNNGGDGFVAARLLAEQGCEVQLVLLADPKNLKGDALLAWQAMGEGLRRGAHAASGIDAEDLKGSALLIDALFGAGLKRDLDGAARALVDATNAANASGVPILAVDLPSGINGEIGQVHGVAVRADHTVTFFRRKPGHLLFPGRAHCGRQHLFDIGIPSGVLARIKPRAWANAPGLWLDRWTPPGEASHKYTRGHVVVVSGGVASTGAARLSATAALRAGAGLVTLASPPDALAVNASHLTAVMLRGVADAGAFADMLGDTRIRAAVVGPGFGIGERARAFTCAALMACTSVLDADALTSFEDEPSSLFDAIETAGKAGRGAILAPHEGEFARLFGRGEPGASRLDEARRGAVQSGAVVVLKGPDTVIAAPDDRAAINENGTAWLATAGSGDVLAGMIAGFVAQGLPPFEAACAGVWCHGAAAEEAGAGLISEDLLPAIRPVIARLAQSQSAF